MKIFLTPLRISAAILLAGTPGWAISPPDLTYRIDRKPVPFVKQEKEALLISRSCADTPCKARKALESATTIGLDFSGGANPGARICRKIGGEVVIGLDGRKNEVSFCRFDDGSMVSSGSVHSRAVRNDLAR